MNEIIDTLCHCPIFGGKDKIGIKKILSRCEYKISRFEKNEFIFRIDQPSVYLGIIIKGSVEVQKTLASGKVVSMFYKNNGEAFGGAVVLSNKLTHPCDIIAREKSEILLLHRQSIFDILCKDSVIASNLFALFANSILVFVEKIELFSYSSIQKKIAFSLLNDMKSCSCNIINLPYSKKSWAEHLNVSRPSLCRELKNISNDGIVEIKNKSIKIINKERLESILMD